MFDDPLSQETPAPTRSRFPGPMVVNASGDRITGGIAGGALFVAAGVWLARMDGLGEQTFGWVAVALGGTLALYALSLLIPGRAGMILDREGVTILNGFSRWKHRWSDMSDFQVFQFRGGQCVVFKDRTSTGLYSRMNRVLSGGNGYIPTNTDIDAQDMKRLLESWRARAMAQEAPKQ